MCLLELHLNSTKVQPGSKIVRSVAVGIEELLVVFPTFYTNKDWYKKCTSSSNGPSRYATC